MSIFESLENLNVSEECFDDIMGIVEEIISEGTHLDNAVTRAALSGRIPIDTDKWPELSKKQ